MSNGNGGHIMELKNKLKLFQEMLQSCYPTSLWVYDFNNQLVYSNCSNPLMRSVFEKAGSLEYLYSKEEHTPACLGSMFGILWGAVFGKEDDEHIYLIGPVLNANVTQETIEKTARRLIPLQESRKEFMHILDDIPVVPLQMMQNLILMLHNCVTGETIQHSDIQYQTNKTLYEEKQNDSPHNRQETYLAEKHLLYNVREGNLDYQKALTRAEAASTGVRVSMNDPIGEAKLSTITFTSLCTRAAIEGRLDVDTAYTVGDTYIQAITDCSNISEIRNISHQMYDDFIHRVHRAKNTNSLPKPIQDSVAYIQLHPDDELSISMLAKQFGYSDYYFSRKFKKETGISVTDYIDAIRVKRAKMLLETTKTPISEIAASLHFCSSTHFSTTFKNSVGLLPNEYRKQF